MTTKPLLCALCLLTALSFSTMTMANNEQPSRTPSAKDCYWVVETGRNDGARYSIIRFYDGDKQLLFTRRIEGSFLNASRAAVQKRLNKELNSLFLTVQAKNTKEHTNDPASLYKE